MTQTIAEVVRGKNAWSEVGGRVAGFSYSPEQVESYKTEMYKPKKKRLSKTDWVVYAMGLPLGAAMIGIGVLLVAEMFSPQRLQCYNGNINNGVLTCIVDKCVETREISPGYGSKGESSWGSTCVSSVPEEKSFVIGKDNDARDLVVKGDEGEFTDSKDGTAYHVLLSRKKETATEKVEPKFQRPYSGNRGDILTPEEVRTEIDRILKTFCSELSSFDGKEFDCWAGECETIADYGDCVEISGPRFRFNLDRLVSVGSYKRSGSRLLDVKGEKKQTRIEMPVLEIVYKSPSHTISNIAKKTEIIPQYLDIITGNHADVFFEPWYFLPELGIDQKKISDRISKDRYSMIPKDSGFNDVFSYTLSYDPDFKPIHPTDETYHFFLKVNLGDTGYTNLLFRLRGDETEFLKELSGKLLKNTPIRHSFYNDPIVKWQLNTESAVIEGNPFVPIDARERMINDLDDLLKIFMRQKAEESYAKTKKTKELSGQTISYITAETAEEQRHILQELLDNDSKERLYELLSTGFLMSADYVFVAEHLFSVLDFDKNRNILLKYALARAALCGIYPDKNASVDYEACLSDHFKFTFGPIECHPVVEYGGDIVGGFAMEVPKFTMELPTFLFDLLYKKNAHHLFTHCNDYSFFFDLEQCNDGTCYTISCDTRKGIEVGCDLQVTL